MTCPKSAKNSSHLHTMHQNIFVSHCITAARDLSQQKYVKAAKKRFVHCCLPSNVVHLVHVHSKLSEGQDLGHPQA